MLTNSVTAFFFLYESSLFIEIIKLITMSSNFLKSVTRARYLKLYDFAKDVIRNLVKLFFLLKRSFLWQQDLSKKWSKKAS